MSELKPRPENGYTREEQRIVEQLTGAIFGYYISMDKKTEWMIRDWVSDYSFQKNVLWKMLTIIEAVVDKEKVEPTKSIIRQMLDTSINQEVRTIYKNYKN